MNCEFEELNGIWGFDPALKICWHLCVAGFFGERGASQKRKMQEDAVKKMLAEVTILMRSPLFRRSL